MTRQKLDPAFRPRQIAVIGASDSPGSVGRTVMDNLFAGRLDARVFPVNPRHDRVRDMPALARVDAVDGPVDLALVCTPANTVPEVVRDCARAEVGAVVILSAGFGEASEDGEALEQALRETVGSSSLRVFGPNCLGFAVPHRELNASFAQASPLPGPIAFASQSGALCTSMLDWAREAQLGFSHFVSLGNMLDVDFGDVVEHFADDPHTRAMVLYIESVGDAESAARLLAAARGITSEKPIVACKSGRSEASAEAASSHTGALAGEDEVFDAAFRRVGIERARHVGELFDAAQLLARHPHVEGSRLAIVTNAGGPGVLATDAVEERGVKLAQLSDATAASLAECLPPHASTHNPVDVLGDATPEHYLRACEAVLADPGVDALLVILTPQAMTDGAETARAVAPLAAAADKPVLAAFMGAESVAEAVATLREHGIPAYRTPEQAVAAFGHLVGCMNLAESAQRAPAPAPVGTTGAVQDGQAREAALEILREARASDGGEGGDAFVLDEAQSMALLSAYGIPVAETRAARSAEHAVELAEQMGYPVAIKVRSTRIAHKSDMGAVALGLETAGEVREACTRVLRAAGDAVEGAEEEGVTVQAMAPRGGGLELILGAKHDPTFGPVLMVGLGGTTAELMRDRCLELPPVDAQLGLTMLRRLRGWPLLEGYRGQPGVSLDAVTDTLQSLSNLVLDLPGLRSLDVNPLAASARGVLALDARVSFERQDARTPSD